MRTILLCILISVLSHWAWGQEIHHGTLPDSMLVSDGRAYGKPAADTIRVMTETLDIPIPYSLIPDPSPQEWFAQELLGLLKAYSDECRADSTLYWTDIVLTGVADSSYVEPWGWVYSYRTREEKYYTHREPTFTGFREFLKRKVKP